ARLSGDLHLKEASLRVHDCAEKWRALALPLAQAFEIPDAASLLPDLIDQLEQVAQLEEAAWQMLKR
ncbi:MAG TPA: DUF4872 domain-containing protein, partial [Anaerolineae bacterium]|nr:DUF4872 domain-containing protein [Anaerolineae bacterium]